MRKPEIDKTPSPPADPVNRREPLPSQHPKPSAEDPDAPARIKAIMESPGYRRGDQDLDFLGSAPIRGIRLQIDYLKPELLLEKHNVHHTIVVFGSTRICEPVAAQRRVDGLKASLAHDPAGKEWAHRLAVAERVLAKSKYYDVAREFGRLVGKANRTEAGPHCTVVTGGGPGIMEAANRGAFDVKAETIGLNISLPHEQYPNPYITPELCFNFHYFAMRKLHFLLRARALVAFPGGYGTFDELFEALTLVQTRKMKPIPIVLVGESYWRGAVDLDFLVDEGVIDPEDRELLWFAETAQEIWDSIRRWYDMSGESLDGSGPLNRV
ncbi:MAG: TIGR00730 family Rossman fold protein [Alphaproteobacteria bacterium]|nr:TIGR00730 family Rossman fold protein [Alphaproteobacteria bacterium]